MKFLFPLIFILISCGDDDMKKYSKLSGLRILAITADNPQINSASTVRLTPYLSYPEANDTTIDISFEACIDPGIAYGAELDCKTPFQTGTTTYDTTALNADFYTGPITPVTPLDINVPAASFTYLATLNSDLQFNGVDVIVILTFTDQSDSTKTIKTFKRISLTSKSSGLNTNPTIGGLIQSNSSYLTSFPTTTSNISLDSPSDGEAYQIEASTGLTNLNETMTISWFSNVGEFKFSRTDKDETVEFDPQGETAGVFVAVYRDNRGGVVVIKRVLP